MDTSKPCLKWQRISSLKILFSVSSANCSMLRIFKCRRNLRYRQVVLVSNEHKDMDGDWVFTSARCHFARSRVAKLPSEAARPRVPSWSRPYAHTSSRDRSTESEERKSSAPTSALAFHGFSAFLKEKHHFDVSGCDLWPIKQRRTCIFYPGTLQWDA